jgi:hemerythrin
MPVSETIKEGAMQFFQWDPSYSVGIAQFDAHHKELMRLLSEAHENFMVKAGREPARIVLDRLVDYAQYHFTAEEKWMQVQKYSGLEPHTAEHDEFWRKIFDLQKKLNDGSQQLSFEILIFLREWLVGHILGSDAEYCRFADQQEKA